MLTLWTDTFCTLPQANASRYLVNNAVWAGLTNAEKRQRLKDATDVLNRLRYRGVRDSSTQALSWPRSMKYLRWPAFWFEDAYINNEIAQATCAQVAYDIHRPGLEKLKGQSRATRGEHSPRAMDILTPYLYINSVNLYEDPEKFEDPDKGYE